MNDSGATFVIAENEELGNRPRYYLTSGSDDSLIDKTDGSSKIDLFHLRKGGIDPYIREGTFNVNPYIKLTATAGVLANLINVSVNGSAQLNMTFFTSEEEDVGSISLNASIGVTVLFISASWPFFSKDIPLFGGNSTASLAGMDELNYLHDSSRVLQSEPRDYFKNRSKWNTAGVSVKSLDENENGVAQETLRNGIYSGTDVKLTALNDQGDYLGVFLDDETDASGKQVRDDINSAAVYYDVYDHETGWSDQPILLENDGKADQDVSVFDLGDRGIMVTWAAANKVFTEADSRVGMMNAMDIHGAFFDKKAKTFGQIMQITHETEQLKEDLGCDVYGDTSPNVVYNKDHMLVYYTKSDYAVSDEGEGEVIGDVIYPADSQMVYRVYKFTDTKGTEGTWIEDYKELPDYKASPEDSTYQGIVDGLQGGTATYEDYQKTYYGQVFFATAPDVYLDEQLDEDGYWKDNKAPEEYLGHNVSSNVTGKEETGVLPEKEKTEVSGDTDKVPVEYAPKIIDKDAISYNDLGLFAYTVDYDQSMSTVEDRDIYFQIYDFEAGTMSHPIMVTSDNVSDGNVRFIRVTSEERKLADTYLVWLSDGNIVGLNISNVVREDGCLKKKTSADNVDYYMIDKSRAENADDQKYIPPMTLVEGEVAEDQENAVSAISSFDVNSTDGFVYLSWTQQESALKDGVEEDSEEAAQAENQRVETQVYMARYDMAEDCMTKPVQVTSEEGANYDNLSFVVNSDATLTALATKAKSKTVTADEFNETIEEYNQTHSKDEKQDKVDEKDFVEYAAPDQVNKSLVMMNITPVSVMKVDEVTMDSLIAGEDNMISIRLLNDGIDTLTNAVLTVKDENGKSVLQEQKVSKPGEDGAVTAEYKTVDSITIDKLMGGNIYDASAKLALDEDAEDAAVTIQLTDASGRKLIDERHTGTISSDVLLQNFQVKETDERDVYDVTVDIQNSEARFAEAGEAVIGIEIPSEKKDETTDGETAVKKIELATVPVKSLARSESTTLEKQVKVDSLTQFIKSEGDNGFIHEKGTFYVEYRDQTLTEEVERTASGAQMNEVNSIQKGMIGDGSGMKVALGHIERAQANIKSSLADEKLGLTGTEGLQVLWKMDDESIATVDDMGNVSGIKEGSTKLTAYVMPKNSRVSASVDEGQSHEGYYFGNEESNYVSLPNDAIRKYTTTVTVKAEAAKQQTPAPSTGGKTVVKSGVTYRVSGSSASAVSAKKTITSVSVPATVKIGGKSYKVTKIAANAFKNCKKLKKATIGKNVISIDRNAFYGCTKLTKVSGGKNVRSIGKSAFYGCKKLTKITIGNKVKSIGSKAFYKCSKLTKVTIGKKVKSIGSKAFYGCKRVKTILFKPAKAPKIGSKAFKGVASKAVFRVPKKSRKKYRKVLKKKAGVTAKMKIKA